MSSRSTRTKAKKRAFVKAHTKSRTAAAKAAEVVIKNYRMAKLRPGAAGVYRALLNPRVQGFLGLEKKFYDTAKGQTAILTTDAWAAGVYNPTVSGTMGSVTGTNCLSVPSQGSGPQQRIGKAITIKSLQMKGTVTHSNVLSGGALPVPSAKVFVALVLDTQTNGAQCTAADIFTNLAPDYNTLPVPMRNLLNSKRFKILKSDTFDLDTKSTAYNAGLNQYACNGNSVVIDWYLPMDLPVNFIDETDQDIGNVVDNSIHVIAASSSAFTYLAYSARIRFLG